MPDLDPASDKDGTPYKKNPAIEQLRENAIPFAELKRAIDEDRQGTPNVLVLMLHTADLIIGFDPGHPQFRPGLFFGKELYKRMEERAPFMDPGAVNVAVFWVNFNNGEHRILCEAVTEIRGSCDFDCGDRQAE